MLFIENTRTFQSLSVGKKSLEKKELEKKNDNWHVAVWVLRCFLTIVECILRLFSINRAVDMRIDFGIHVRDSQEVAEGKIKRRELAERSTLQEKCHRE